MEAKGLSGVFSPGIISLLKTMINKLSIIFEDRTQEVQIECKACSKDGLKYICSVSGRQTFRIRKNEESAWVAKHEYCPEDPGLIKAIGDAYEKLR